MEDLVVLEWLIHALVVMAFVFTTSYVIPKGIYFYSEWKKRSSFKCLSSSVSLCSVGVLFLLYLLMNAVFKK